MHLNLHLLRMFKALVDHQGFSRAAEHLFVTQSAVSKGIRELEHQLDLPLIERQGARAGIRLTDSGRALYEHARAIFAMEQAAAEDMRERIGLRRGRLRIGASTTIAAYWLPTSIARFAQANAHIELKLVVGNTARIGQSIIDGDLDVAFVEGAVEDVRIEASVWRREPLRVIAAHTSTLGAQRRPTAAQLASQTWLMREAGSGTRQVAQDFLDARGIMPQRTIELGSNEAIAQAVAEGAGISLLPAAVVADLVAIKRVRSVTATTGVDLTRPLYRLELAGRPRPPALQAFVEMLAEVSFAGIAAIP